jgi:hypothetical protein
MSPKLASESYEENLVSTSLITSDGLWVEGMLVFPCL